MELPGVGPERDIHPEAVSYKPVVELLQNPAEVAKLWPEYDLTEQIAQHVEDVNAVYSVIDALPSPTTTLQEALEQGHVSEGDVTSLYSTLSTILENPDYERLALYIPFEFLPDSSWNPENIILNNVIDRFEASYMHAWGNLLHMHDVRANFIDGDVMEDAYRTGDVPRVVKAAHLIPELVTRGMLTEDQLRELLTTPDPVLKQSINEAIGELYNVTPLPLPKPAENPGAISPNRQAWLKQKEHEQEIDKMADTIADTILEEYGTYGLLKAMIKIPNYSTATQAFAEGVLRATQRVDTETAREIVRIQRSNLEIMWGSDYPDIQDRAASVLRRLHRADLVTEEELARIGITLPSLSGPFSENLREIATDMIFLKQFTEEIAAHPLLQSVLYHVVVVGGSKLKGYGGPGSDVDVSVFVKPDTLPQSKAYIRNEIEALFARKGVRYEPTEFWLDKSDDQLTVRDLSEPDIHTADSLWTHVLFEGAWVGNEQAVQGLLQKLLPAYFHPTHETVHGVNKRALYLQRLEQDVLQYRLLHKGYERHHLRIDTNKTIDKSVFWDPGYRQLATKLFVSNVFLPKITS